MSYSIPIEIFQGTTNALYEAIEMCNRDIPLIRNSINKAMKKWPERIEAYSASNVPLKLRLAIADMAQLFINVINAKSDHERNLIARLVCGQLYEFLEDVPKMFGKRYRKHYAEAPKYMLIDEQITQLMKIFNETRNQYHTYLKDIRHNVASHRDDDGMKQAEIIDTIEPLYIINIFLKTTGWFFTDYIPYERRMMKIAENLGFGPDLNV